MKERLIQLKEKAIERAGYYCRLDFPILANEFTEFADFLHEMENVINRNEELEARLQSYEEETQARAEKIKYDLDGEGVE